MSILVTGSAGFIGSSLCSRLLASKKTVVGVDNHNDYYSTQLKQDRIKKNLKNKYYNHIRADISDKKFIDKIFETYEPEIVINLAAQAGVRYSIENPDAYIQSNIVGFANILEGCRNQKVKHLIYASSSSVYGSNLDLPFSTNQNVDNPLSLYAATKKSNELMAYSYSHLYGIPTTGLRFFTVYGPWGRPDMALFKFTKSILASEPIKVFNYGKHLRDFTYIDDIVEGIIRIMDGVLPLNEKTRSCDDLENINPAPARLYNIGNNQPIELLEFISILETTLGKKAEMELLPLQKGDVLDTFADVTDLENDFKYKPRTSIKEGILKFIQWYYNYYKVY